jgi:hypothetical protein
MTAAQYDLPIKQGEDVDFTVQVWANDAHTVVQVITGWTAKMQIKDKKGGTVLQTLTDVAGLTINGPAGQVAAHIAGTVTGAYTWSEGVYDLFVFGPANVPTKCIAEGSVTVNARVTT